VLDDRILELKLLLATDSRILLYSPQFAAAVHHISHLLKFGDRLFKIQLVRDRHFSVGACVPTQDCRHLIAVLSHLGGKSAYQGLVSIVAHANFLFRQLHR
jgi:hypothetical protein